MIRTISVFVGVLMAAMPFVASADELSQGTVASHQTAAAPADINGQSDAAKIVDDAHYKSNPRPKYPAEALKAGQEGTVIMSVNVDKTGTVISTRIKKSSGVALIDQAGLDAMKTASFVPYVVDGEASAFQTAVPIKFSIYKPKSK